MRACFKFLAQPYELMPQSSCLMVRDSEAGKGSVTCLGWKDLNPGIPAPESMSAPWWRLPHSLPLHSALRWKIQDSRSQQTEPQALGDMKTIVFSSPRKASQAPLRFLISCVSIWRRETYPCEGPARTHTAETGNRPAGRSFPLTVNTRALPLEGFQFADDVGSYVGEMEAWT